MVPIDIVFLIACIYVPCLVLLYLAEIWTILKPGSPFKGSFYYLFVAGSLADLIFLIDTTHELRLVFFPLVNGFFDGYECLTCAQIRINLSYMCPFAQDMLNTFIALNRFTSIGMPTDHARIWAKLLPIAIIGSVLVPFAIFFPTFWRKVFYTKMPLGPGWDMYYTQEDFSYLPWYKTHRITSIEMIITSVLIIVLYTLAARALRKLTGDTATRKQERKLLIFGVVNFFLSFLSIVPQVMIDFNLFPIEWVLIVVYQYTWLTDIKTFCAAVTMVVVNTTFRKHMLTSFKLVRRKNSILVASTSSHTGTNT